MLIICGINFWAWEKSYLRPISKSLLSGWAGTDDAKVASRRYHCTQWGFRRLVISMIKGFYDFILVTVSRLWKFNFFRVNHSLSPNFFNFSENVSDSCFDFKNHKLWKMLNLYLTFHDLIMERKINSLEGLLNFFSTWESKRLDA